MESLSIKGMSCQHCVDSVKKALEEIPGISNVSVDLEGAKATFQNSGTALQDIQTAIKRIGFVPGE